MITALAPARPAATAGRVTFAALAAGSGSSASQTRPAAWPTRSVTGPS